MSSLHAVAAALTLGLYLAANLLFLAGNTVGLAVQSPSVVADSLKTAAACLLLLSTAVQLSADSSARISPNLDVSSTRRAIDFPSAHLNVIVGVLIVASTSCFLSYATGGPGRLAGAILLVTLSCVAVVSTQLMFVAEIERTIDVAVIARTIHTNFAASPSTDSLDSVIARSLAEHDESVQQHPEAGTSAQSLCCRPRNCISVRALLNAAGWWVLPATFLDLIAALALLAASLIIVTDTSALASLIILEIAFSLFVLAVSLIICGGPALIAAHRRGGRAHFELDVRRALRREGLLLSV